MTSSPRLIVEVAFNTGASTGSSWHIGDPSRGIIGQFTIGESDVFTDITSYMRRIELTSGASSRVTSPLVEYEAGTARLVLDNSTRAFDPTNVDSPFYTAATTVSFPVPGTLPNALEASATVESLQPQVTTSSAAVTNATAIIATATVSSVQPTVTGTSARSGPNGMLFGASPGGDGATHMSTMLGQLQSPAVIRTYESLPSSWANTGQARFAPPNTPQYVSFKPSLVAFSDSTAAGYDTIVTNLRTVLRGLSNIPGHRAVIWHEPEDNVTAGTFTVAQWRQGYINMRNDVVDVVNADANRTHPIWLAAITQGWRDNTSQVQYFTTAVVDVLDEINWDCYGFDTATPADDQINRLHDFAVARGMPWSVGELGYSTKAVSTDAQMKSAMVMTINDITAWPASERPVGVMWFDSGKNALAGSPNSIAYWKNVCINTSVPAS